MHNKTLSQKKKVNNKKTYPSPHLTHEVFSPERLAEKPKWNNGRGVLISSLGSSWKNCLFLKNEGSTCQSCSINWPLFMLLYLFFCNCFLWRFRDVSFFSRILYFTATVTSRWLNQNNHSKALNKVGKIQRGSRVPILFFWSTSSHWTVQKRTRRATGLS